MAPDSMVVSDGVEETTPRTPARSGWPLVAAGFVIGLAFGALVAPDTAPAPADATTDEVLQEGSEPRTSTGSGISGAVPGFPDALVAVTDVPSGGLDHLLWPIRGGLDTRSMALGGDVSIDSTGQYVAMSEVVPGLDGVVLSMGRFNDVRPLRSGVSSYAWHDSRGGELAFTREGDDGWQLYRVSPRLTPELVTTGDLGGGSVAAWGDWGYAIQRPDRRVVLLTHQGVFKDVEKGEAVASHDSGWVLVEDDGLKLVSAGGGVRRLDAGEALEVLFGAAFAPDGRQIAVAGRFGVLVYDLGGEVIAEAPGYPANWVAWSSDSRFVITPAQSGVFVSSLDGGGSEQVLIGHEVVVAGVLPLSSS